MKPWKDNRWLPGVLSKRQTISLINENYIEELDDESSIGFSSFDLHLADEGYLLCNGSIKPCGPDYDKFLKESKYSKKLVPIEGYYKLEKGNCYVFRLKERIVGLKDTNIFGQATAKSSIGRLDIIARLIVDGMQEYESFNPHDIDKLGRMYLEITPLTFNIKVSKGTSLSQLRLFYGNPNESILSGSSYYDSLLITNDENDKMHKDGTLSVDLTPVTIKSNLACAFKAIRDNVEYIDLNSKGLHNPNVFWSWEVSDTFLGKHHFTIKQNEFYILRSKEKIYLPDNVAVYCRAMDENLGEMRIHYAGFVHPFFGTDKENKPVGTPLIFEVRGHNVDVNLSDSEKLARLTFYKMSDRALDSDDKKSYNDQNLTLSNHFKEW